MVVVDVHEAGPRCPHPSTFDCHGTPRCSDCYTDMQALPKSRDLPDGGWMWPAQDDPMKDWDGERIAKWFLDNRIHWLDQGCDGFTFQRNNLIETDGKRTSTYGYVWVEGVADFDLEMLWLLDIRRHDVVEEHRQFLVVATTGYHAWHDVESAFRKDSSARSVAGFHFLANEIEAFFKRLNGA